MKVISLNGSSKLKFKRTCVAIGIFDGVHRGHQYLILKMIKAARRLRASPLVITFFPHPAHVLRPDIDLKYLNSLQDRFRFLSGLGVAYCLVVPFDKTFARIEPEDFIKKILVRQLGVKAIFVGEDFRFGKDRSGDIGLFKKLGPECGYAMHPVSALKQGRQVISSTRIRLLISAGKLKEAAALLGRPVSVSGPVIKGSRRGKALGFPTANVDYQQGTVPLNSKEQSPAAILPPKGVYLVKAHLGRKVYPALANIGTRPSFERQKDHLHLEVYILNFSKNIYGRHIEVQFIKRIREEKKFSSPQELIQQIQKDIILARKALS